MTRRRRPLSAEERNLWETVARRTEPLSKIKQVSSPKTDSKKVSPIEISNPTAPKKFRVGENASHSTSRHNLSPTISQSLSAQPVQMDGKNFTKMKRGRLKPEGRIDLHGMTLSEAHPELINFILSAHSSGKRLVLVITGKGKHRDDGGPIPRRFGVLRHQVPQWLSQAPVSSVVLQVAEAHATHGGYGALYVYLRRKR